MNKRALGPSGLEVLAVGYGCMALTPVYGTRISRADAVALIQEAVERGVRVRDGGLGPIAPCGLHGLGAGRSGCYSQRRPPLSGWK
jgi:hypothetical protein